MCYLFDRAREALICTARECRRSRNDAEAGRDRRGVSAPVAGKAPPAEGQLRPNQAGGGKITLSQRQFVH
jgi:hypothetical protein